MKKFYSSILLAMLAVLCSMISYAQVSVTATAGTPGPTSYTTLKAAFDAINAGTHQGTVSISITGNTTETATATINASGAPSSYTAINITTTGAHTITMAQDTAIITFNGADNITLDGNNTLQLVNNNPGGNVLRFINDATNNTIKNVTLKGFTTSTSSGVVSFGPGSANGNDDNTIDNCSIDGSMSAAICLFSNGTTTSSATQNSGNTVKNSRLFNNLNPNLTLSATLYLAGGNTDWTIENNSFFHTNNFSTTQQMVFRFMLVLPSWTSDAHEIRGNFVGGNAPNAAGTWSVTGTGTNIINIIGMDIETGGTGNRIRDNIVRNINITYASTIGSSFVGSGIFAFIGGFNGTSTLRDNTVSNINLTNNAGGFISFQGIHANGRVTAAGTVTPVFEIDGNTVTNISATSTGNAQLQGIRIEASSGASLINTAKANPFFEVKGNTISSLSLPSGGAASYIRGIGSVNTQGTSATALLHPAVEIDSNIIHTLISNSILPNYAAGGVVSGINFAGATGSTLNTTDVQHIGFNTIYNLSSTNTVDSALVVTGILATTGIHEINGNKIYDLKNSAPGTTKDPGLVGINVRSAIGATSVTNNFVSLGSGQAGNLQIFGILNNFNATGPLSIYHNSVVIAGAGAAGNTKATAAFMRGTEAFGSTIATPLNIRNNILYNNRTGGGAHYAIVNTNTAGTAPWTSDYNNLYSANSGTVALWGTTPGTLAAYKASSGDANSVSVTVSFADIANGDLHLAGASVGDANLNGIPIASVTRDIDDEVRSTTAPTMGADEVITSCTPPDITTEPTAQTACEGSSVTFTVVATGTNLAYQWRKGTTNISGATSATLTLNNVAAGDAGAYNVIVSNTCGSETSADAVLTVNPSPAITTQPVAQAACPGGTATFTVVATGTGITYQWLKDGSAITGETNATLTISNVSAASAGNYSVEVTAGGCTVTSNAVALTLNAAPAITTQPSVTNPVCLNTPLNLTVAASGAGPLTYQWRKDGADITGATSATYSVPNAQTSHSGIYSVVVTGACGSVTSNDVTVNVDICSSVPVIDADITSAVLMPSIANDITVLRIQSRRSMNASWNIIDANGRLVMTVSSQLVAGQNDIRLQISRLAPGVYQVFGITDRGTTTVLRFIRQ